MSYLKSSVPSILDAISKSLSLLYTYVLFPQPAKDKQLVLIDPLLSLVSQGNDLLLQLSSHNVIS